MDEHTQDHDDYGELGPTYKSLFIGACLIIGSAFGWWLTNFISTVDRVHHNFEQKIANCEQGVAAMEKRQDRASWEVDAISREVQEIKRRLK